VSTSTTESSSSVPERKGFYVRGWILAAVGVVVVAAAAVAIGFAVSDGGDGDRRELGREGGRFGDSHGGGGHGFRIIVLLILIALAIAAAVLIARRYASRSKETQTSAEAVLAERFARGEIDETDYLSRRNALRS
jgi:putative membrane protein